VLGAHEASLLIDLEIGLRRLAARRRNQYPPRTINPVGRGSSSPAGIPSDDTGSRHVKPCSTAPVVGTTLASKAVANGVCAISFGPGWRMAEFHDGRYVIGMDTSHFYGNATNSRSPWPTNTYSGGFDFFAFGNVRDDTRYWVRINDQPANCWNH
jgi:hypothetical protein